MIITIPQTPDNIAAFKATGEITKEDFENCVIPQVKAKVNQFDELNYLLFLDTDVGEFSMNAWYEDAMLGLKNLTKWNRAAIVTDQTGVQNFTDIFSMIMPGEVKSFPVDDLENAVYWCANGNENK